MDTYHGTVTGIVCNSMFDVMGHRYLVIWNPAIIKLRETKLAFTHLNDRQPSRQERGGSGKGPEGG